MTEGASLNSNQEARKRIQMLRKQISLEKLCAVFNDYILECYPKEELTWTEFDSVFSSVLNNCEPLYKILSERHIINIYEVFISLVVFLQDVEFEDKVLMIFKAFDVSGDGVLDRKELSKFVMCAILGLCKITCLPEPSRVGIKQFTYAQFKIVDDDGSG